MGAVDEPCLASHACEGRWPLRLELHLPSPCQGVPDLVQVPGARARTVTIEGAVGSVGKRINVAGCAAISLGMPTKIDGTDWGDLNHTLCYLGPGESIRTGGDDVSHVEVWAPGVPSTTQRPLALRNSSVFTEYFVSKIQCDLTGDVVILYCFRHSASVIASECTLRRANELRSLS